MKVLCIWKRSKKLYDYFGENINRVLIKQKKIYGQLFDIYNVKLSKSQYKIWFNHILCFSLQFNKKI